ncbi:hypothetical protein [Aliarcobacter vitoriensis]|uniref:Uncharacterized protein n=1 Tax=Aliarcobacter vitoriensis TaxID=2011099 RepID=A0A366MRZ1_9BACT|nr:hypothetical protein [Aliarcobacter vitoriensis]RBQ28817.1 hypothetical protein CRU91_07420 [Aliarcobacter vitoriensis]
MKNKVFISVLASMMLSGTMLNAKEISLQEAVENIVKRYNVTYISKANNLKDKSIDSQKVSFGGGYGIK